MRWIVAVAVGIAVLALAAFTFGAKKHYSGSDLDPQCDLISEPPAACTISFDAKVKKGKVKSVSKFVFERIPITCDQGSFTVSNTAVPVNGMKVNKKRKFKGTWNGPDDQQVKVTGNFSKNWKSAKGTVTDKGDFPPTATDCRTGKDEWKATR
jgi:hypothetical protein